MNRKTILCVREFFVTQMNHWAISSIVLLLFGLTQSVSECEEPNMWIWLAMGTIPFAFYFLRIFLRRFLLLLGGHLAILLLFSFLLPTETSSARTIYLLAGVGYTVYSIAQRLRGKEFLDDKIIMPVAVGVFAAAAFLLHYLGYSKWDSHFLLALIAVFGLHFLSSYLESYLHFLTVNESSTGHIPEREIFVSGFRLMVIFVLFSVAALFFSSHLEWLGAVMALLRTAIFAVLRLIVAALPNGGSDTPPTETPLVANGGGMMLPEARETFFLWVVLENIAIIVFFCGLAYLILRLLLRIIRFIRERMKRERSTYKPQTWEKVYDVREKCSLEKTKKKGGRTLLSRLSAEERVRKLYKNHIESAAKRLSLQPGSRENTDPALRTAREWSGLLGEEELAPLYEKARYSGEEITAEELRRMKDVCKGNARRT